MNGNSTVTSSTVAHIQCDDLVRIFSAEGVEVQALQGLTLAVERGELTAIVGASGSGKSTLLTMSTRERTDYRRNTVGFVWQQTSRNLLSYLSAAENLAMTLAVANHPKRTRGERITDLLELLGIGELRDRLPAQMSGGQQQRVAIAIALANEPEVLFADEPTGELDEANSMLVFDAMRDVNERLGVTVLIVTHDQGVSSHVRRTVQIRDGRTSTEVLRSTRTDEHGVESHIAEEFAVLDRVGRLQLPQEYITRLAMRDRVRLELESTHVEVHPTTEVDGAGADEVEPNADDEGTR